MSVSLRPPEVLASIGKLELRTYGLVMALAVLSVFIWAEERARKQGIDRKLMSDVLFWGTVAGIVGARFAFILQNLEFYTSHTRELLSLQLNGLSIHGALLGGLVGFWLSLRAHTATKNFWRVADVLAAPLLLGPIIGRIGNWANQELYGYPTDVPWAIIIDEAHRLPGYETFSTFHPTFAYEALLNLLGLLLLVFGIEKIKDKRSGSSFLFVLGWYGVARFITEIWRIGDPLLGPLSLAQVVSLGMIMIVIHLYRGRRKNDRI